MILLSNLFNFRRKFMRAIDLADELYERLQQHGVPFEDTPADVISRALDALDAAEGPTPEVPEWERKLRQITAGVDLVSHVGRVPHGTQLMAVYKGKEYHADVRNGQVIWNGQPFPSLSAAAVAVIRSSGSSRATEDGWRFWLYLTDDGEWRSVHQLRAA